MTANKKRDLNQAKDKGKKDPSFVLVFVNKLSEKNPGVQMLSKDPYVKL